MTEMIQHLNKRKRNTFNPVFPMHPFGHIRWVVWLTKSWTNSRGNCSDCSSVQLDQLILTEPYGQAPSCAVYIRSSTGTNERVHIRENWHSLTLYPMVISGRWSSGLGRDIWKWSSQAAILPLLVNFPTRQSSVGFGPLPEERCAEPFPS